MKSKERLTQILTSFDEGAEIWGYRETGDTVELLGKDGQVLVPSYAAIETGYERESGKFKSTIQVAVDPTNLVHSHSEWLGRYDQLFAVDTNTRSIDGHLVSASCSVRGAVTFNGHIWSARIEPLTALVTRGAMLKPEIAGWLDLLERVNKNSSLRLGVVVDSELGDIPRYNLRTLPLADGILLPRNVELIYASSDRDKNAPFNCLLSKCDATAGLLLDKLAEDPSRLERFQRSSTGRFEWSFYWEPTRRTKLATPPDGSA